MPRQPRRQPPEVIQSPVDIPPGQLVLVAYANQPIALQTCHELLRRGCHVRAITPWDDPAYWLDDLFEEYRLMGHFRRMRMYSLEPVHQIYFIDVLAGVDAAVFTCQLPNLARPTEEVWDYAEKSVIKLLECAAKTLSIRAVVYTSALAVAAPLVPKEDQVVDASSWNVPDMLSVIEDRMGRCNYITKRVSALVRAEQALWKWYYDHKEDINFKVNVVSPSYVIGQRFGAQYHAKWRNWIWRLYRSGRVSQSVIPDGGPLQAHWYVDVEDVALLEVAAIFEPEISGARIHAWGCYRNVYDAINALEQYDPKDFDDRTTYLRPSGDDGIKRGVLTTSTEAVEGILAKWKGPGQGFKSLEQTIKQSFPLFSDGPQLPPPVPGPDHGSSKSKLPDPGYRDSSKNKIGASSGHPKNTVGLRRRRGFPNPDGRKITLEERERRRKGKPIVRYMDISCTPADAVSDTNLVHPNDSDLSEFDEESDDGTAMAV